MLKKIFNLIKQEMARKRERKAEEAEFVKDMREREIQRKAEFEKNIKKAEDLTNEEAEEYRKWQGYAGLKDKSIESIERFREFRRWEEAEEAEFRKQEAWSEAYSKTPEGIAKESEREKAREREKRDKEEEDIEREREDIEYYYESVELLQRRGDIEIILEQLENIEWYKSLLNGSETTDRYSMEEIKTFLEAEEVKTLSMKRELSHMIGIPGFGVTPD